MSKPSLSLYAVSNDYMRAMDELLSIEDLPEQAIKDTLEGLAGDVKEKSINVAAYFRNIDAEIEAIKNAETEMKRRRNALENHSKRLKEYLLTALESCEIQEVKSPWFVIKIAKNPASVDIYDEKQIPRQFFKIETIESIDRNELKKIHSSRQ